MNPSLLIKTKYFFGLAHTLGYKPEFIKDRAKTKFNLASFKNISHEQLDWLINSLEKIKQAKEEKSKRTKTDFTTTNLF